MTDAANTPNTPGKGAAAQAPYLRDPEVEARLEVLVSKLADAEGSEQDWAAFNALAATDPRAWRELALAQRQHGAMSVAVGVALHAADRVDLPQPEGAGLLRSTSRGGREPQVHSLARFGVWAGWATAALIALSWGGFVNLRPAPPLAPAPVQAGVFPVNSFEDAQRAYLALGQQENRVLSEVPERLLIEARPLATGATGNQAPGPGARQQKQFEVVYVRQFVERAVVNDLVRFGTDETGRAVPVPYSAPVRVSAPQ